MKKLCSVIMASMFALSFSACSTASNETDDNTVRTTRVNNSDPARYSPYSSAEYVGMNYEDVSLLFQDAGFETIKTDYVEDIDSDDDIADGSVESVTIKGADEYSTETVFDKGDEVLITYHRIPRITAPLSSSEASSRQYMDVGKTFFDAGFRNIETDEVYDLAIDEKSKTVLTAGGKEIQHGEQLPFDSGIDVIEHFPSRSYPATLSIDFLSNLIFSKYDVILSLNGQELGTMPHGEDASFTVAVPAGTYEVLFTNKEDHSVTGRTQLEVNSKTDVSYQISCHSSEIAVDRTAFNQDLKPGNVLMPFNSTHYLRKNYKSVSEELSELGFSRINTEATTDMLWKPDRIDTVVGIEIDGKTDFKHDDSFNKNSQVTIYYHMADFAFEQESVSVTEKDTFEIPYILSSEDPLNSIEFNIDRPEVLQRNKDGSFTALKPGTAIVSAYSGGEKYSECTVEAAEIIVPIEKLEFASEEFEVSVGSTFKPDYKVIPENANYTDMRIEISNNLIEQVEDSMFYSLQEGDSEMSFYQDDRLLGTCIIHAAYYEIEELSLKEEKKGIHIGDSFDVSFSLMPEKATSKGIVVVSSNNNVATAEFDERGEQIIKVTGISAGEANIIVTIPNGQQYSCAVTVNEIIPEEIVLKNTDPKQRIEIGTPIILDVSWKPDNTSVKELTWSSSDNNVIRVGWDGSLEAVGVGTADITATHKSGVSGSITLVVEPTLVEKVEILSTRDRSAKFYVGESFTISATVSPENAHDHTLKFFSSNEKVVKVNEYGVVTAVGEGSATITVSSPDGPKSKVSVIVSAAEVTKQNNTVDDCGWVSDASWEKGGYCSYHPEWYGLTTFDSNQNSGGSGSGNSQSYNDPYSGPAPYIASVNSDVFHNSWCSSVSKIASYNKLEFYSREDAVNSGRRPCKKCNP